MSSEKRVRKKFFEFQESSDDSDSESKLEGKAKVSKAVRGKAESKLEGKAKVSKAVRGKAESKLKGKAKVSKAVRGISITKILVEQENRRKSVHICIGGYGKEAGLINVNVHNESSHYKLVESEPGYPPHLFQNDSFGVACLGSKIYYIGGCNNSVIFNTVSVLDLATGLWTNSPALNHPRNFPVVLTFQNNLFVFGSRRISRFEVESIPLSSNSFIEYYDATSDKWHYVPSNLPGEFLNPRTFIRSHAFSEVEGVAYFLVHPIGVYSFDFKSMTWEAQFKSLNAFDPRYGLCWSNQAVFIHSFLIWHHFGTIYSFSLSHHAIRPIFTFREPVRKFGDPCEWNNCASPSYLLNVGNGKLCLVYGRQHNKDSDFVKCHVFDIQYSCTSPLQVGQLTLTHEGCKFFHHKGYEVSSVFTMDDSESIREVLKICPSWDRIGLQ